LDTDKITVEALRVYVESEKKKMDEEKREIVKIEQEFEKISIKPTENKEFIINSKGDLIEKPSSNNKCHCGSGYKYKKCCMQDDIKRMQKFQDG